MSEKTENKNLKTEKSEESKTFKYGVYPFLAIAMVRDNRAYRFEMPVGAHLDECKEACTECLAVIKKMREEADAKAKAAEDKAKEENKEKE